MAFKQFVTRLKPWGGRLDVAHPSFNLSEGDKSMKKLVVTGLTVLSAFSPLRRSRRKPSTARAPHSRTRSTSSGSANSRWRTRMFRSTTSPWVGCRRSAVSARDGGFRRFRHADDGRADERCGQAKRPKPLHFPTVLGADVLTYNVPGVTSDLNLAPRCRRRHLPRQNHQVERSEDRFRQPRREAAGQRRLTVVHRSDGSGTTFIFTEYLSKVSPEWKTKVGANTSVQLATRSGRQGKRRRLGSGQADAEFHRLCGTDLRSAAENAVREREERIRQIRQSRALPA